jgi:hypothetical protein
MGALEHHQWNIINHPTQKKMNKKYLKIALVAMKLLSTFCISCLY